jgi:hypothetical protein
LLTKPVLVVLVLSAALLQAQRAGGGRMSGGQGVTTGLSNGFFPLHSGAQRHRGSGAFWLPWGAPYWDDDGYFWDEPSYQPPANPTPPQVIVVESKDPRPPAPPLPPEPPKLIEVPQSKDAPIAKALPPTLFVLKDGERIESRYYMLTDQSLQIEIDRQRRTIPVSTLDLDATIAANHLRGIDVTIPRDRSSVFLSF